MFFFIHFAKIFYFKLKDLPLIGKLLKLIAHKFSLNYIKTTQEELNKISPSFCKAKWLQSTLHLELGETHSCHHNPRHSIDINKVSQDLNALHNTTQKIQARQEMINGVRPKDCDYCWKIEDHGSLSDRVFKSSEEWASLDAKTLTNYQNVFNILPKYLEVSFSSQCNLKCAYCDPLVSSSIRKEIEIHGPYPTSQNFQRIESKDPVDSQKFASYFWRWWPELKSHLHTLRVTGGEPFLSSDFDHLLSVLSQDHLPHLNLSLNSNLMVSPLKIENGIKIIKNSIEEGRLKDFHLYPSIDTWGKHAEFLRWGLSIKKFSENIELCLRLYPKIKMTFLITFQALSIFNYQQLLEYVLDLRRRFPHAEIKVGASLLRHPDFLSINLLPKSMEPKFLEIISFMQEHRLSSKYKSGFSPFEITRFERICIDFMATPDRPTQVGSDFMVFIKEFEKRKNIHFEDYFDLKMIGDLMLK